MRLQVAWVAAATAVACAGPDRDSPRGRTLDAVALAAPAEPRPPDELPASTRVLKLRDPPARIEPGVADVVVDLPRGLVPAQPLHLVVFFHGSGTYVEPLLTDGGLAGRHDDAGKQSILVAPQISPWAGTPGRFGERGYLSVFLEETLAATFDDGPTPARSLDDVADLTLVAHSAGHIPLAAVLERGNLADRVRNVVLLDGIYDGAEPFARWLAGARPGAPRKLVSVHGPWGGQPEAARALLRSATGSAVVDPGGSLEQAVREHDVTLKTWRLDHGWMPLLVLTKILAGLDLPPRAVVPTRAAFPPSLRPATTLALPADVPGALDAGDTRLQSGALADDFALELAAGQAVTLDASGGRSLTENADLDTYLQVLDADGAEVASDDDGGGRFDPHLVLTVPRAGRYVVRLSTYGSGEKRGPYRLRAR